MTADFTLSSTTIGPRRRPDEFLDLNARVACRGFGGRTMFAISRRDVDRFLADAAKLPSKTSDTAQLLGGWDDAEERLAPPDHPRGADGAVLGPRPNRDTGPQKNSGIASRRSSYFRPLRCRRT